MALRRITHCSHSTKKWRSKHSPFPATTCSHSALQWQHHKFTRAADFPEYAEPIFAHGEAKAPAASVQPRSDGIASVLRVAASGYPVLADVH